MTTPTHTNPDTNPAAKLRKLEIGPELKSMSKGEKPPRIGPDWELLDVEPRPGVDWVGEWGKPNEDNTDVIPLPFPDDQFDHVYASHVLEHVWWYLSVEALRDALRVLKPGGQFECWVPDFGKVVAAYQEKKPADRWRRHNPTGDYMRWVNGRIFTYGPGVDNWHRAVFDADSLQQLFRDAGFADVHRLKKPTGPDIHGWINLGVAGIKPLQHDSPGNE